jgi:dolichol-phosphate mannosyltransferase
VLSILAIPFVVIMRLATGVIWFEGQATAIIIVLLVGSAQFFFSFVMGQYLGRIYDEVRGRPLYIIADTFGLGEDHAQGRQYTSGVGVRHRVDHAPPELDITKIGED